MKRKMLFIFSLFTLLFLVGCENLNNSNPTTKEKEKVSIIFDTKTNDVLVDAITGYPGDAAVKPEDPIREGYKFKSWQLNGADYSFTTFPNRTIILTALWDEAYKITFETDDYNKYIEPLYFLENEDITNLPILTYKIDSGIGYIFLNWQFEEEDFLLDVMPPYDLLLTPKWEEALMVSFNTGSNDEIEPIVASYKDKIVAPNVEPLANNKVFMGWYYNGKPYIFDKMPNETIELEARYLNATLNDIYNTKSNLPKMFINLENNKQLNSVNREEYVNSSITILSDNQEDMHVAISSEFKGRGHGSWTDSGPKKGYRLKFFNKVSLFGEEASKHWVLLAGANFYDDTLSRNAAAFNLARDVFSNIEYTTSINYVELYINGDFRGVYMVAEHVRVDKGRVDIESKFGVLDTGYLIEYDAYAKEDGAEGIFYFTVSGYKHPIAVKRPDPEDYKDKGLTEEEFRAQVNYIKNYTTTALRAALDKNLTLFMEYVDINSFIDMYLLHELFKNTDGGWSSFFMYKKPGGKLYAGPAWDFDASAGKNRGDTSPYGFYVSGTGKGSVYESSNHTSSELFISLMQIEQFRTMVSNRWNEISSSIKDYVNDFLSSEYIEENKFSFGRNFYRWSGQYNSYGYYSSISDGSAKWENNVVWLRNWLLDRSNWFDEQFS